MGKGSKMAKPRKKNADPNEVVTVTVKVPRHLRDSFSMACRERELTVAQALRFFMREMVAGKRQFDMFSGWK